MADFRTEEEQIELLKNWWKESGTSTLAGVAIAVAGWLGWSGWQHAQIKAVDNAAALYQPVLSIKEADVSEELGQLNQVAQELRSNYPDSMYAVLAALRVAKAAVDTKDLNAAYESLVWARAKAETLDPTLDCLIALRLARLQFAQSKFEDALATIVSVKDQGAFKAAFLELKGDIHISQGNRESALGAYSDALAALESAGGSERKQDLELKLADLSPNNGNNGVQSTVKKGS
jgi:predicted negative regulator of RcsB-dependent stress response